jgi:hypothetical protein
MVVLTEDPDPFDYRLQILVKKAPNDEDFE